MDQDSFRSEMVNSGKPMYYRRLKSLSQIKEEIETQKIIENRNKILGIDTKPKPISRYELVPISPKSSTRRKNVVCCPTDESSYTELMCEPDNIEEEMERQEMMHRLMTNGRKTVEEMRQHDSLPVIRTTVCEAGAPCQRQCHCSRNYEGQYDPGRGSDKVGLHLRIDPSPHQAELRCFAREVSTCCRHFREADSGNDQETTQSMHLDRAKATGPRPDGASDHGSVGNSTEPMSNNGPTTIPKSPCPPPSDDRSVSSNGSRRSCGPPRTPWDKYQTTPRVLHPDPKITPAKPKPAPRLGPEFQIDRSRRRLPDNILLSPQRSRVVSKYLYTGSELP